PVLASELSKRGYSVSCLTFYGVTPGSQLFWENKFEISEDSSGRSALKKLQKFVNRIRFIMNLDLHHDLIVVSAQGASIILLCAHTFGLVKSPVAIYVHEPMDAENI